MALMAAETLVVGDRTSTPMTVDLRREKSPAVAL